MSMRCGVLTGDHESNLLVQGIWLGAGLQYNDITVKHLRGVFSGVPMQTFIY